MSRGYYRLSLHSTMMLLRLTTSSQWEGTNYFFTFHYDAIKTALNVPSFFIISCFTFHYDAIKTYARDDEKVLDVFALHSTMMLLRLTNKVTLTGGDLLYIPL